MKNDHFSLVTNQLADVALASSQRMNELEANTLTLQQQLEEANKVIHICVSCTGCFLCPADVLMSHGMTMLIPCLHLAGLFPPNSLLPQTP